MDRLSPQDEADLKAIIAELKKRLPLIEQDVAEDVIDVLVMAQEMLNRFGGNS